jgi:hypothetical protein
MKFLTIPALAVALSLSAGTAMANHHEGHHGKDRMEHYFTKMDANKDGVVNKTEFTAKSVKMFNKMDANGDGMLTRAEAKEAKKEWRHKKGDKKHHKKGCKRHNVNKDRYEHMKRMDRDAGVSDAAIRGENAPTTSRVLKR